MQALCASSELMQPSQEKQSLTQPPSSHGVGQQNSAPVELQLPCEAPLATFLLPLAKTAPSRSKVCTRDDDRKVILCLKFFN